MPKIPDTIQFDLSHDAGTVKCELDSGSVAVHERAVKIALKKGLSRIKYKRMTEGESRSNEQNKFYWSHVLRIICEYVDGMESFAVEHNGRFNYDGAHRYLTLKFAIDNDRTDLLTEIRTKYNKEWITVPMASFSFDKMSHKDATQYLDYLEKKLIKKAGCGFEMIRDQERREAQ